MSSLQKNIASQNFTFCLVSTTTGLGVAGATVSGYVTKDAGSQAASGGTVTSQGNGQYNYAPTQAETNANDVGFMFTASGCVPCNLDFHTDQVDSNGYLKVDTVDIGGTAVVVSTGYLSVNVALYNSQNAVTDSNNFPEVGVQAINGSITAANNVGVANQTIGRGTATSGGTTTSIPTSTWSPGGAGVVSGQFIGRTMIFDYNTTTAALRGQASNITANTSGSTPTFTVSALTTAPASGDTFGVY